MEEEVEEDLPPVEGWVGVCLVGALGGESQAEDSVEEEEAAPEEGAPPPGWVEVEKATYLANSHLQRPQGHFHGQMDTCLLACKSPFHRSRDISSSAVEVGLC